MTKTVRPTHPVLTLAGAESLRHLRNPILWLGTCATIAQAAGRYADGEQPLSSGWVTGDYETVFSAWSWLFLATFVIAALTAGRHTEPRPAEVLSVQPTDAGQRMTAVLLAGIVPTGQAALAAGATCAVVARAGGIATGDFPSLRLIPTAAEAAVAVAIIAVGYTLGVAAALTISSRPSNVLLGALITFLGVAMYWIWGYPRSIFGLFAVPLSSTDLGPNPTEDVKEQWAILHSPADPVYMPHWAGYIRDTDMTAWHAVYLSGIVLLLSAYAIRRATGRVPRWPAVAGLLLAAGGAIMQILTYSGTGN
jgi:hypothetical protein